MILVVSIGLSIYYFLDKKVFADDISTIEEVNEVLEVEEIDSVEEDTTSNKCYFDVKGEVKNPGVYEIDCSKRIIDAVNLAGGLTSKSDTSVTNLSKKIEDGMVIKIYSNTEVENYLETIEKEETLSTICENDNVQSDSCIGDNNDNSNTNESTLININTASLEELMTLSGIGEAKAQNIITYRTSTPFETIEDIMNVDGIGEAIFANIKENITV